MSSDRGLMGRDGSAKSPKGESRKAGRETAGENRPDRCENVAPVTASDGKRESDQENTREIPV